MRDLRPTVASAIVHDLPLSRPSEWVISHISQYMKLLKAPSGNPFVTPEKVQFPIIVIGSTISHYTSVENGDEDVICKAKDAKLERTAPLRFLA